MSVVERGRRKEARKRENGSKEGNFNLPWGALFGGLASWGSVEVARTLGRLPVETSLLLGGKTVVSQARIPVFRRVEEGVRM